MTKMARAPADACLLCGVAGDDPVNKRLGHPK